MTRDEAIEELKCTIDLIKQDGKDWLDERDIPLLQMAIEALEHLNNIEAYMHDFDVTEEKAIKSLERKKGEWLYLYEDNYKCSVCGSWYCCTDSQIGEMCYCPNCGAEMCKILPKH